MLRAAVTEADVRTHQFEKPFAHPTAFEISCELLQRLEANDGPGSVETALRGSREQCLHTILAVPECSEGGVPAL